MSDEDPLVSNLSVTQLKDAMRSTVAGIGAYPRNASGPQALLGARDYDRIVLVGVVVTQAFADVGGDQPVFNFGETDFEGKYGSDSLLAGAVFGEQFHLTGVLSAQAELIVMATPASLGVPQQETATIVGTITPGTKQAETATIVGTIGDAGNAKITVTAAGMSNSPKDVAVAVDALDDAAAVAGKARTALAADPDVSAFFDVSGAGADIILTRKAAAANDATMNIASDNDTCTGLTPAATSANTTAGQAPGTGNASITLTSGVYELGNEQVPVLAGDTASDVAAKVRAQVAANEAVTEGYDVSGSGADIILTAKVAAPDDPELNIASTNGTCTGLTPQATSVDTTPGEQPTGAILVTAFAAPVE